MGCIGHVVDFGSRENTVDHLHYEFDAEAGDVAVVTLDAPANVQFMDNANYDNYRSGRTFRYHGGYVRCTPFRLQLPESRQWHLVVDLGGGPGHIRAYAELIPAAVAIT